MIFKSKYKTLDIDTKDKPRNFKIIILSRSIKLRKINIC